MTIIETNIERVLHDTLWKEIDLIDAEIKRLANLSEEFEARRAKLVRIAEAADIPRMGEV